MIIRQGSFVAMYTCSFEYDLHCGARRTISIVSRSQTQQVEFCVCATSTVSSIPHPWIRQPFLFHLIVNLEDRTRARSHSGSRYRNADSRLGRNRNIRHQSSASPQCLSRVDSVPSFLFVLSSSHLDCTLIAIHHGAPPALWTIYSSRRRLHLHAVLA
jgi:hypothetical protein